MCCVQIIFVERFGYVPAKVHHVGCGKFAWKPACYVFREIRYTGGMDKLSHDIDNFLHDILVNEWRHRITNI